MSPPTTRAVLAAAVRRTNAAFARLDPEAQERCHLVGDEAIDGAVLDGNRQRAIAEIEAWRDRQLAEIDRAAQTIAVT